MKSQDEKDDTENVILDESENFVQDRGMFLYDMWCEETGAEIARNPIEKHLIGEAINNALFEETGEYSSILKRCHLDHGTGLDQLVQQFGEDVKTKIHYLFEMYLLEEKDHRLHVTDFYRHLIVLRQRLAAVQLLF